MKLFDRILFWCVCLCIFAMTFLVVVNREDMNIRKDFRDTQYQSLCERITKLETEIKSKH